MPILFLAPIVGVIYFLGRNPRYRKPLVFSGGLLILALLLLVLIGHLTIHLKVYDGGGFGALG